MKIATTDFAFVLAALIAIMVEEMVPAHAAPAEKQPAQGTTLQVDLGHEVSLEVVYIPPGEFKMGSTPAEKAWATGIEGGATPGGERESYEGEKPRSMRRTISTLYRGERLRQRRREAWWQNAMF